MAVKTLAEWIIEKETVEGKLDELTAVPSIKDGSLTIDYDKTYERLSERLRYVCLKIAALGGTLTAKPSRPGWDDDGN